MELKGRLKLISDKIPNCETIIDVGTDHAYIPIYALQKGICKKALATDVKSGPVEIAKNNIRKYGLEESGETRLGYGLEPVHKSEIDVVIIAGMGGMLIQDILYREFEKAQSANLLILQPMNAVEVIRRWLYESGFDIIDESLAGEGRKIYNVLCAKWTGKEKRLDDYYYYIGYELINKIEEGKQVDPLLKRYLENKLNLLGVMIEGMKKAEELQENLDNYINIRNRLLSSLEKSIR